jgi:hypothetical protein
MQKRCVDEPSLPRALRPYEAGKNADKQRKACGAVAASKHHLIRFAAMFIQIEQISAASKICL